MKTVIVTKSFKRNIVKNYQSYNFATELTETFEVDTDEELAIKSAELFAKCMRMVATDIKAYNNSKKVGEKNE